ncbi:MAG: hypothetical protein IJG56_01080, partial [Clostridia bacterium]|nr:hypothetical protein [Clostridia bacterium]
PFLFFLALSLFVLYHTSSKRKVLFLYFSIFLDFQLFGILSDTLQQRIRIRGQPWPENPSCDIVLFAKRHVRRPSAKRVSSLSKAGGPHSGSARFFSFVFFKNPVY